MSGKPELKIRKLQVQIKELQEAHNNLKAHYHEFVKATVQALKEINEEE